MLKTLRVRDDLVLVEERTADLVELNERGA
jgi:hypothetical protein